MNAQWKDGGNALQEETLKDHKQAMTILEEA